MKEGLVEQIGELPLSVHIWLPDNRSSFKMHSKHHYWSSCTDDALDELTEKLAPLMKFREQRNPGQGTVKLDLTDVLHNKEMVEFGPRNEAVSVSKYRETVEAMVLELTHSNPILQKIKSGADISAAEAEELAKMLNKAHPHITENLLRIVYRNRKARFIQFIRHIFGIEVLTSFPDTVVKAFDQFIAVHTNLNSRQLEFLRLLKDFMIEREKSRKTRSHSIALHHHSPRRGFEGYSNRFRNRRNSATHGEIGRMRYGKTTDEELALILEEGEGYTLEFKRSINSDLPKELTALANASGGRILIGINDHQPNRRL